MAIQAWVHSQQRFRQTHFRSRWELVYSLTVTMHCLVRFGRGVSDESHEIKLDSE